MGNRAALCVSARAHPRLYSPPQGQAPARVRARQTRVSAPQPDATDCLGRRGAGTRAQCHVLFWIPLYPIHSQAFAAGPPSDSQGWQDRQTHANCKRAISVGRSVETKLVWNVLVAAEAKKYAALGTIACPTTIGDRAGCIPSRRA